MTYSIRLARPEEANQLSTLAMRSKAYWQYSEAFMSACRAELTYTSQQINAPQCSFYVCSVDNAIIGFYALVQRSETEIELEALFVEPQYIGRGFGQALMGHAKNYARQLGALRLVIQGDPNAEKFYLAAGAVYSGSRESDSIAGRQLPVFTIDLIPAPKERQE